MANEEAIRQLQDRLQALDSQDRGGDTFGAGRDFRERERIVKQIKRLEAEDNEK